MRHTIPNPPTELAKGIPLPSTFIPYIPEIPVGIAITMVIDVRYFMTLFSLLSITDDISSLVPFMISR